MSYLLYSIFSTLFLSLYFVPPRPVAPICLVQQYLIFIDLYCVCVCVCWYIVRAPQISTFYFQFLPYRKKVESKLGGWSCGKVLQYSACRCQFSLFEWTPISLLRRSDAVAKIEFHTQIFTYFSTLRILLSYAMEYYILVMWAKSELVYSHARRQRALTSNVYLTFILLE